MHYYANFIESNWVQTYKFTDQTWLNDSLNWEKISTVVFSDFSFFYTPGFLNQHVLVDYSTKVSQLDVLLLFSNLTTLGSSSLYNSYLNDLCGIFFLLFSPMFSFFSSSYQDIYGVILIISPELLMSLGDYFFVYYPTTFINPQAIACFDSYANNLTYTFGENILSFVIFLFFIWIVVYFFTVTTILRWSFFSYNQYLRFYLYFFSLSKDVRLQFEVVTQTAVFFFFYWSVAIMAFDDDKEELIEYMDSVFFYFFSFVILFFFFKHSIHYFSFLEASASGSRSTLFLVTQFKGDFLALFSMILRFYSLLLRLNVYDILDDCLDLYYVFIGDFDDDEYFNELFFSIHGTLFFTMDNQDDRSFLLEDENDFSYDFFYTYFMLWGKIFYFLFYTVELVARFGLAFYVIYLVLFEIYGVNCSFKEDYYFFFKKNLLNSN